MTDATNTPGDDVPLDPPEPPLPPLPPDANRRYDHAGELLPPLDADRTPAPPAISSSFGEEVPRDA